MNFRRLNFALLGLILAVNGYTILAPVLPSMTFWWQKNHSNLESQLTQRIEKSSSDTPAPAPPAENRLVVPGMLLDQPVLEGKQVYKVLDKGILHWPASSTPDKGGNTVIIGHRFTYTNPRGVFYQLDKLKVGDPIGLYWNKKLYRYTVTTTEVVPPTQTSIQENTAEPQLTLFTCTPLWNPKNRLVVIAQPIANQEAAI